MCSLRVMVLANRWERQRQGARGPDRSKRARKTQCRTERACCQRSVTHCLRHTALMEKFSLTALVRSQMQAAVQTTSGTSAKTVYGGHEHVLRQTLIGLRAGAVMAEHANPGEATLHVLAGRVRLVAGDDAWEGRVGDLLIVPPGRHSVEVLEDAAVLLTVGKRQ
jgi:quercetin dioxygenase-like cupin family protein